MKAVLIVYSKSLNSELIAELEALGLHSYTRVETATGRGKNSGPHLGTHVWPDTNSALLVVGEEGETAQVMTLVRRFREKEAKLGVKAFSWDITDVT